MFGPIRTTLVAATLAAGLWAPTPSLAQAFGSEDPNLVDRVVAVVGDSVVLLSQIQTDLMQMQLQGRQLPTDPSGLQRLFDQSLNDWVDRVLILQAAARDSLIRVDQPLIESSVQEEIDRRTQAFGGPAPFQQALQAEGLTLASYRDLLATQIRQEQIQQLYMQRRLQTAAPIVIDESELRQSFEEARAQLEQRPRLVSFEQVVLTPAPSAAADSNALAQAHAILDSIRAGAEFEEMARRHSDDPGSAPDGGNLDWFRRGAMVREFEDAAFGLLDGQISEPVKTEFGYHLIKIERSRAGERLGRHILLTPDQTEEDLRLARAQADSVAAQARSGVSMAALYDRYTDGTAPDTLTVTFDQLDQLPPGYGQIRTAAIGDVIGPVEYQAARGETRLAVIRVRNILEAGEWTFEDLRPQLEQRLIRQKQIERVVEDLRARTYVEIRG